MSTRKGRQGKARLKRFFDAWWAGGAGLGWAGLGRLPKLEMQNAQWEKRATFHRYKLVSSLTWKYNG